MKVLFEKLHSRVQLPQRQTEWAAGYDIRAFLEQEISIPTGAIVAVPTGLKVQIPEGYHLSVRPRSGLALKHGITLVNSPGTIDSDFRGEIKILVINLGSENFILQDGERIAQLLLEETLSIEWQESSLTITERAGGGFGSTGTR